MTAGANAGRRPVGFRYLWLLVPALAAVELGAFVVVQTRVVPSDDWAAAAAFVRGEWASGDVVTASPAWADPLLRAHLGDRISLAAAGRSDLAAYRRLWALSLRGHRPPDAPDGPAELSVAFGRVRVLRWTLPEVDVRYDFLDHIEEARVALVQDGEESECTWRDGRPSGGGLGAGPITAGARHGCDPARRWLWVGVTTQDTLDLQPRRCIWQHAAWPQSVRARFEDVPLGRELVFYGGLYYEHERDRSGGPLEAIVTVGDTELGRLSHEDGDGWQRLVFAVPPALGARGDVTVEVQAPNPDRRSFCWAATTRGADR